MCIYPIDMLPQIFRYGYAAPFYNISQSVRTIVFGTRNRCKWISRLVLPPLLTDGLIGYSGQKLFYTYCMDGHLLHNAHDFPVVRKEKRRRCGEGTIYEAK